MTPAATHRRAYERRRALPPRAALPLFASAGLGSPRPGAARRELSFPLPPLVPPAPLASTSRADAASSIPSPSPCSLSRRSPQARPRRRTTKFPAHGPPRSNSLHREHHTISFYFRPTSFCSSVAPARLPTSTRGRDPRRPWTPTLRASPHTRSPADGPAPLPASHRYSRPRERRPGAASTANSGKHARSDASRQGRRPAEPSRSLARARATSVACATWAGPLAPVCAWAKSRGRAEVGKRRKEEGPHGPNPFSGPKCFPLGPESKSPSKSLFLPPELSRKFISTP